MRRGQIWPKFVGSLTGAGGFSCGVAGHDCGNREAASDKITPKIKPLATGPIQRSLTGSHDAGMVGQAG